MKNSMIIKSTFKTVVGVSLLMLSALCSAQDSSVEELSPELRALLSKEMIAVQEAMMAIIPAYSSGDNTEVASIARQIKDSFILQQKLTEEQKKELHTKLPEDFLQLDQRFHYNAGMLQHAAEMNKTELVSFYFSQLSEACAGCHARFATHRFPFLLPEKNKAEHHH